MPRRYEDGISKKYSPREENYYVPKRPKKGEVSEFNEAALKSLTQATEKFGKSLKTRRVKHLRDKMIREPGQESWQNPTGEAVPQSVVDDIISMMVETQEKYDTPDPVSSPVNAKGSSFAAGIKSMGQSVMITAAVTAIMGAVRTMFETFAGNFMKQVKVEKRFRQSNVKMMNNAGMSGVALNISEIQNIMKANARIHAMMKKNNAKIVDRSGYDGYFLSLGSASGLTERYKPHGN